MRQTLNDLEIYLRVKVSNEIEALLIVRNQVSMKIVILQENSFACSMT